MRQKALLVAAITLAPALAPAEEANPLVYERITVMPAPDAVLVPGGSSIRAIFSGPTDVRGKGARIDINFAIPAAANDGREVDTIRRQVRRWIYDRALRECDRLRDSSAQECRLHAIETTVTPRPRALGGYLVNGHMELATKPK